MTVGLCFVLNMLDGADMLVMSFIAPVLSASWRVTPEKLGVLFSASLVGMAIGCLVIAPLADQFGRRALIIGALALVAIAMVFSGNSQNLTELLVARLFVGIGVGTIGVSITAITAEFAPQTHVDFAIALVQAGWPFASIITAFVTIYALPLHGWQSLLSGIGELSAVLLLGVWIMLPESLSFLAVRRPGRALERFNVVRRRLRLAPLPQLPTNDVIDRGVLPISALFQDGRALPSVLLWSAVTLSYFVLYFVISWIPKLVVQAGLPVSEGLYAGAVYNLGAFMGTSAVGWIAIHWRLNRVVAAFLGMAAVALLIFGELQVRVGPMLLAAMAVGITVQGGFNGFWGIAARLYPAEMRSTGIGWALGVGRIGALLGPIVGGLLVGANLPMAGIFEIYTVPLIAAALMTVSIKLNP